MTITPLQLITQYWFLTSEMSWVEANGHIVDLEKLRKERADIVDQLLATGHTGPIPKAFNHYPAGHPYVVGKRPDLRY